jgi:very-short-patch-repair endonuclease
MIQKYSRFGKGNSFFGRKHTEETRAKMKANHRHQKTFLGRHHTEETKEKLRQQHIGLSPSLETREKLRVIGKNRIFSEAHRKHLSEAYNKDAHAGYVLKHTDDFKRKLSERNLKNWKSQKYIDAMKNIFWNTEPERQMKGILSSLGINFVHCFRVSELNHPVLVDFYLPDYHAIIETDGKHWHDYPFGREIDHIRTGELRDAGYVVFRFWENDFDRDSVYNCIKNLRPVISCVVGD